MEFNFWSSIKYLDRHKTFFGPVEGQDIRIRIDYKMPIL